MTRLEELDQQLWDYVYQLLADDEAAALEARIHSDPAVARRYADVKLQTELVAAACRVERPHSLWKRPVDGSEPDKSRTRGEGSTAERLRPAFGRIVNWSVTIAASVLVAVSGYAYWTADLSSRHIASPEGRRGLAANHLQVTLVGPEQVQQRPATYFTVATKNLAGEPKSVDLAYRFYGDNDQLLVTRTAQTNRFGLAQIATPAEVSSRKLRLEVVGDQIARLTELQATLPVQPAAWTTHLTIDKPLCQPNEVLSYRSLTLSRFDLQPADEIQIQFEVHDEDDRPVSGSHQAGLTVRGVGNGQFRLPENMPSGRYALIARSPAGRFPTARRDFQVRPYRTPVINKRVDFAHDSYGPGEQVVADVDFGRADGETVQNLPIQVMAQAKDRQLLNLYTTTDERGRYQVRFSLPDSIAAGEAELVVTTQVPTTESIRKTIPVVSGQLDVACYPEGGELVPGVENRVYFFAHDVQGRAVHITGCLVDSHDDELTRIETIHDGRGMFRMIPEHTGRYRLRIESPVRTDIPLPSINPRQWFVLNTGPGVFAAGQPIELAVHASQPAKPLSMMAVCRGSLVGQELVDPEQFVTRADGSQACTLSLPIAKDAEGVIRVTAYDYATEPPTPLAERLVYRRPTRRLDIRYEGLKPVYAADDTVQFDVAVLDADGQPRSAALGADVVDRRLLMLADDHETAMDTHFWLTSQLDSLAGLEDANFYLKPTAEAEQALDLLLGTQGWRRFPVDAQYTLAKSAPQDEVNEAASSRSSTHVVASRDPTAPLVLANNVTETQESLERAVASFSESQQQVMTRIAQVSLIAGGVLLVLLIGIALRWKLAAFRGWAPAFIAATACLLFGLILSGQHTEKAGQQLARSEATAERNATVDSVPIGEPATERADMYSSDTQEEAETLSEQVAAPMEGSQSKGGNSNRAVPVAAGESSPSIAQQQADVVTQPQSAPEPRQPQTAGSLDAIPSPAPKANSRSAEDRFQRAVPLAGAKAFGGGADGMAEGGASGMAGRGFRQSVAAAEPSPADPVNEPAAAAIAQLRQPLGEGQDNAKRRFAGQDMLELPPISQYEAERQLNEPRGTASLADETSDAFDADSQRKAEKKFAAKNGLGRQPVDSVAMASDAPRPSPDIAGRFVVREYAFEPSRDKQQKRGVGNSTLYWNPLLLTDENGRASIRFGVPREPTDYRLRVEAHGDGHLGSNSVDLRVRRVP